MIAQKANLMFERHNPSMAQFNSRIWAAVTVSEHRSKLPTEQFRYKLSMVYFKRGPIRGNILTRFPGKLGAIMWWFISMGAIDPN